MLSRAIRQGDVVVDVGANVGDYTMILADLVGSKGQVHAFEAVPATFRILSQNVGISRLSGRIILNLAAISSQNGRGRITVPASDFSQASLVGHRYSSWKKGATKTYPCRVNTLDDYVEEHAMKHVKLVKIDVEGAEMLALIGMKKLLMSGLPPILMLELFPPWMQDFGYGMEDVFSFLRAYGYSLWLLGAKLVECRTPQEASMRVHFPDTVNFVGLNAAHHANLAQGLSSATA